MNDQDLTDLLQRTVASDVASPAPVRDVTTRGRHLIRFRRAIQIGGSTVAVAAVAIAATTVSTSDHRSTAPSDAGPPTRHELIGAWTLETPHGSIRSGTEGDPNKLYFRPRGSDLWWSGFNGCNFLSGKVRLHTDGSFRAFVLSRTQIGCLGISSASGTPLVTAVSVVRSATSADLSGGTLTLYRRDGSIAGTFGHHSIPTGASTTTSSHHHPGSTGPPSPTPPPSMPPS